MAWKTKKQRKLSKLKRGLKVVCFVLLILSIISFSGVLHSGNSEKETIQPDRSSTCILKQSDLEDGSEGHSFGITIDNHYLKIKI